MNPAEVGTLLTALAALFGVIWTWVSQRHKPKIDLIQSEIAEQQTISAIRSSDIESLRSIITNYQDEVALLRDRVADCERRTEHAERAAREARRTILHQSHYIQVLLESWGQTPTPPAPPVPLEELTNHHTHTQGD